jgi:hypothetical protein
MWVSGLRWKFLGIPVFKLDHNIKMSITYND